MKMRVCLVALFVAALVGGGGSSASADPLVPGEVEGGLELAVGIMSTALNATGLIPPTACELIDRTVIVQCDELEINHEAGPYGATASATARLQVCVDDACSPVPVTVSRTGGHGSNPDAVATPFFSTLITVQPLCVGGRCVPEQEIDVPGGVDGYALNLFHGQNEVQVYAPTNSPDDPIGVNLPRVCSGTPECGPADIDLDG